MKPTSISSELCYSRYIRSNYFKKRTTTYLRVWHILTARSMKVVCTLKQKNPKNNGISRDNALWHGHFGKKNLSAAFLKSSLLSTMTLSQKYSATSWKRSSISLPAPKSFWIYPSLTNIHRCKMKNNTKKQDEKLWKKFTLFSPYNKRENNNESCPVLW